jgi:glycosyltransferase involved in cell wall biosynthesis
MRNAKICLAMIVKNEAPVIARCLASVLPVIDYWVICDTGSTDGTQDIIRSFFARHGKPGALHERPWTDFAFNRSEALALARPHADYSMIIDADDVLAIPEGFELPVLTQDSYVFDIDFGAIRYQRPQLVRNEIAWIYRGVIHEFLEGKGAETQGHLPLTIRINHDGARRRDPTTYRKDAALLESALATETDAFLRSRYTFYLAQSCRDSGNRPRALELYLARADMGFWQEEVFYSLYQVARLKEDLGHPDRDVIAAFARAASSQASRAEALHGAARFCRQKGLYQQAYEFAGRGLSIQPPANGLFVETWVYEYGLKDEYAIAAYWVGHYKQSLDICLQLLDMRSVPEGFHGRILSNARFAAEKLGTGAGKNDALQPTVWADLPAIALASPAVGSAGRTAGLVSVITPARGQATFLGKLASYVGAQEHSDLEWLVLDDGEIPDARLSAAGGRRLTYEHTHDRLSEGEKRNRLIARARGEYIVHFNHDCYYTPHYIRQMLANLTALDWDLMNLRGWYLHDRRSHFFGYWDLLQTHGPHYRLDGSGVAFEAIADTDQRFRDNHLGYGFSYAYRRKVWEKTGYADRDWNEDGDFAMRAQQDFRVGGLHDPAGICLYILHRASTSKCFPQYRLPSFQLEQMFGALTDGSES